MHYHETIFGSLKRQQDYSHISLQTPDNNRDAIIEFRRRVNQDNLQTNISLQIILNYFANNHD